MPIPANAVPATNGDGNMVVWQPSSDTLWEFWRLRRETDGWRADWGGKMANVSTSPGYYRDRFDAARKAYTERWFWGAPATSLSLAGGVVTIAELQSGHIDHTLYLSIPQPREGVFVFPAQRTDGNLDDPAAIPEGARLRIDPTLDLQTVAMPPVTRMLAVAAQQYGLIVNNVSGAISFRFEDPARTGSNPYPTFFGGQTPAQLLASFPWDRLQVVKLGWRPTTAAPQAPPSTRPGRVQRRRGRRLGANEAKKVAKRHLRRNYRSYRRAARKRVTCIRRAANKRRCRATWKYHHTRRHETLIVTETARGYRVKVKR